MKRVFYFKCSDTTYLKQEVDSTTNSEGVTIQETFISFSSPRTLHLNLKVYKSRRYLLSKDSLAEDGSYVAPYNPPQKRITRRTFKNNFEKALTQININLQSI